MKKILGAMAVLLIGGSCASEKEAVKTSEVYEEATGVREGRVAAIGEDRMILVDPEGGEAGLVLDLTDRTAFIERGESIDPRGIDEGQPVRVFYSGSGDQATALRVEVLESEEAEEVEEELEKELPEY